MVDRARDKIYLDIRQTFSIWFIPFYHADVRLVTILDLVAVDPARHDNGEPLAITRGQEGESSTHGDEDDEGDEGDDKDEEGRRGEKALPHPPHYRLWRISRQEDLYQVNELLKFVGPYWWCAWRALWLPFQVLAAAVSVFLSLFVALSPWASQKDPAAGGVEATVEQIEAYHDYELKAGGAPGGGRAVRSRGGVDAPPRRHTKGRKKSSRQ